MARTDCIQVGDRLRVLREVLLGNDCSQEQRDGVNSMMDAVLGGTMTPADAHRSLEAIVWCRGLSEEYVKALVNRDAMADLALA